MTSMKTCSDKKYSARPYFVYSLKHNLYQLVLFAVVVLLVMVLPCLIEVGREHRFTIAYTMPNYAMIGFCLSAVFGLFCGMTELSYVNNKQSVNCLHSFPLTRDKLFLCEVPAGFAYFIVAITFGFVSELLIYSVTGEDLSQYIPTFLSIYAASVIIFMLVHSATLLAAGLGGTGSIRLIMTGMVLAFPLAFTALIVVTFEVGNDMLYYGYYLGDSTVSLLCPAYRVIKAVFDMEGTAVIKESLPALIYVVVNYIGAFLLNKFRRTEDTGKTVIWKGVFAVTKYLVIFSGAMLGVVIFGYAMNDGFVDKLFGMVLGLVMAFILANCVMYRSVRMMFKGAKSFAVFSALTLVYVMLVPVNIFGIVGNMYSLGNTKEFVMTAYGCEFVLSADVYDEVKESLSRNWYSDEIISVPGLWSETDNELLENDYYDFLKKHSDTCITDYEVKDSEYYETSEGLYETVEYAQTYTVKSYYNRRDTVYIVQKPKFGIPVAYDVNLTTDNELLRGVLDTDEYTEYMNRYNGVKYEELESITISFGEISISSYSLGGVETYNNTTGEGYYRTFEENEMSEFSALFDEILDKCVYDYSKISSSPIVGTISFSSQFDGKYNYYTLPVNASDVELINDVVKLYSIVNEKDFISYSTPEEYCSDVLMSNYSSAIMVNTKTGEAVEIPLDELCDVAMSSICLNEYFEWEYNKYYILEDLGYLFMMKSNTDSVDTMLMNSSAITSEELEAMFQRLK